MKNLIKILSMIFFLILIGLFIKYDFFKIYTLIILSYGFIFYKLIKTKKKLYVFMLIAFSIRLLLIFLDYNLNILPYAWDTGQFHTTAITIKNNIINSNRIFSSITDGIAVKGYSFFVSIIYLLFGSLEINIRIINALLGVLIAEKTYKLVLLSGLNKNSAFWSYIFVLFWPTLILYTSLNMRDTLILYLTFDLVIKYFRVKRHRFTPKLVFILEFIFIGILRKQNIPLFILIFIFYFLWNKFKNKRLKYKMKIFLLLFLLFFLVIFIIQSNTIPYLNINYIAEEMEYRASGGSAYLENIEYNNVLDIFKYLPLKILYFLFGPFLWNVIKNKSIYYIFTFLESSFLLLLFIFSFNKIVHFFIYNNNKKINFLFSFFLIGISGYSSITSNFGTAFRHRLTFIIILFIFISIKFKNIKFKNI